MRSGLKINDNHKWMSNLTRRDGDRAAACMPVQHRNLGMYGSEAFGTMSISPDFL